MEYQKDGYHNWSSNFTVEGGVVTFADYALLIPKVIEPKQIDSSIQISGFISNNDNSKLFAVSDISSQINEVQRNFQLKKIVAKVNIPLVVSGGVSNIKDIRKLHKADLFDGVIIGKAIYDKSIPLNKLKKFV